MSDGGHVSDARTANAIDKRLGERVRQRRLELGMSQEGLADLLGVTFQQIQKYERGVNRIAASRLYDLADALEMPVASFFEELPRSRGAAARSRLEADAWTSPEAAELLLLIAKVKSQTKRRQIVDVVRAMTESASR